MPCPGCFNGESRQRELPRFADFFLTFLPTKANHPAMIRIFIILVLLIHLSKLTAQEFTDTISIKNSFLSKYYTYQDIYLRSDGMHLLMNDIPSAKSELIKSDRNARISGILFTAFLGTLIWAVAANTQDETQEILSYVSGISLVASVPFTIIQNKHEKKAVMEYNKNVSYNKYKQRNGEL
jgi:hypothetical protein